MSQLRIAALGSNDLAEVGALHIKAFPDSAITALGTEAVCRYYRWLVEGPHDASLMGAWQGGRLVGFCAAGVFRGAMNGFLRANRRYLAFHLATHPWLALNPLIRDRVRTAVQITVKFARRRQRRVAASGSQAVAPSFGVLSIATDPAVRGAGAGRALMLDAEERARAQGHTRMMLTVHPDNERAVKFYEQLGWVRRAEAGAWSGSMQRELA
jgi:ribosomal protein S18 acetylase RimI-like enzyme